MNATEKDNVFYCDCGFSWRRDMSGSHNCEDGLRAKLTDMAVQLANAESKCRELAGVVAENSTLKSAINFAEPWLPTCDDKLLHRIELTKQTPATGAGIGVKVE
ncbi:TPA: hypothetical protein ACN014_005506 [Citrobacter freundii]